MITDLYHLNLHDFKYNANNYIYACFQEIVINKNPQNNSISRTKITAATTGMATITKVASFLLIYLKV